MPVLDCTDMARSLAFYKDTLGFDARVWGDPPDFAILQRGTVTIGLAACRGKAAVSRNWIAYVYVADADAFYAEFNTHGAGLVDPDGHLIAFGHTLDVDPLGPGLANRVGRDQSVAQGGAA
jgi:predicted enzyme related to lactoylglutathione lyase